MKQKKLVWFECPQCLAVDLDPAPKPKDKPHAVYRCGRCGSNMIRRSKKKEVKKRG